MEQTNKGNATYSKREEEGHLHIFFKYKWTRVISWFKEFEDPWHKKYALPERRLWNETLLEIPFPVNRVLSPAHRYS